MLFRRSLVVSIVFTFAVLLGWTMTAALAPGGWTVAKTLMLISCWGAAPWVGFCFANGVVGFCLRLNRPAVPPDDPWPLNMPRVAIAVTVRDEDFTRVLPPLRRLLDGIDLSGKGHDFALFVLSDSRDPAGEAAAVIAFARGDTARIHYRHRADNTGFKAGNIFDFLDHHAEGFTLMLVLDADSEMTANAVRRLVGAMAADPTLGIVQHLTVGLPASSAFPRLFQFGMRAGMRTWASSLSWWQGDSCVYWGHNALIRIAPFRAHARLPLLPDGAPILSHDQVEAAILRGAGWGVRLLAEEDGSYEANPPALPEFMRRELRWMAGNFEYRHLLALPGLNPMGRWQLIQAILLFGCTPFYLVFLLAAAWAAATDHHSPFPFGWALTATCLWAGGLYAPKLLGYLEILISPKKRITYGGARYVAIGAMLEFAFTLLLDAINTWAKSLATARIVFGFRASWLPQNRGDRGVSWSEATRLLWPQTLLGILVFAGFAMSGLTAVIWAVPFAAGLMLAIPFCVITANPAVGLWLRRHHVASVPEETPRSG